MQHAGSNARRAGVGLLHVANDDGRRWADDGGVVVDGGGRCEMAVGWRWVVAMTKGLQELRGGRARLREVRVQGFLRAVARPRDGAG